MSRSVELIVEGYLRLNDREALHDILAHRRDLLRLLASVTGIDPRQAVAQVSEEITIIEAGLATLAPD
jgi:inorganic triphosphatase YgiF